MKKRIEKKVSGYNIEITRLRKCLKLPELGKLKKRDAQLMIDMYEKFIVDLKFIYDMPPVWTDEVRIKMIEQSEYYGQNKQIYQFGYYDAIMGI